MLDKLENFQKWFKGKVAEQSQTDVKSESVVDNCLFVKGKITSQSITANNLVSSYVKLEDDSKDGFTVSSKEFYITSTLELAPKLNSEILVVINL